MITKDPGMIKSALKNIIVNDLSVNVNIADIRDDESLFDGGVGLDSIAMVNFIVVIEKRFDISFEEHEINAKLFASINELAEFINAKIEKLMFQKNQ